MEPKSILIISDAYPPQLNGVATTMKNTEEELRNMGYLVEVIHPEMDMFNYKITIQESTKITMPIFVYGSLKSIIEAYPECYIHISTEGMLGVNARIICEKLHLPYSTSFHTKFPEYARIHLKIPESLTWQYFKWFHKNSRAVLTNSAIMKEDLESHGIENVKVWSKGIDSSIFYANGAPTFHKPRLVYSGRVSKEKNIENFLRLGFDDHEKVVIGDGPDLEYLKKRYPETVFTGALNQTELANYLRKSSVFVFPSMTDTFGLVMIEAMACGLPVACFENDATRNIIKNGYNGWMGPDLCSSISHCLYIPQEGAIETSKQFTWRKATEQFLEGIKA